MIQSADHELMRLHRRYLVQASWTKSIRQRMLAIAGVQPGARILEVGSGTGAVSGELSAAHASWVVGIDLDPAVTTFAFKHDPNTIYAIGDGLQLPFANGSFDISLCHFLLLWVSQPGDALKEMLRAVRRGGWIIALAEPDYGGRLDYPPALEAAGKAQRRALETAGANPTIGRQLRSLFIDAGALNVQTGVLGAEWQDAALKQMLGEERELLGRDVAGMLGVEEIDRLLEQDQEAALAGTRTLFVPTFYAIGQAPH